MALIKCPECEKEISDKATVCPSCGCPIGAGEQAEKSETKSENTKVEATKKDNRQMLIVACVVVVIALIAVIFVMLGKKSKNDNKDVADGSVAESVGDSDKQTYREATDLLLAAKYDEAKELFETIPTYNDVPVILEQIPWEVKTFVCIDDLKGMLKAPDSLVIYDVYYFGTEAKEDAKLSQKDLDGFRELFDADEPGSVCLIHYGATNTMGGMTDSAAFFVYDKQNKKFTFFGSTNTLDEKKADDDEEMVVFLYTTMRDNFKTVGDVDVNRINSILKSGVYINVHIME